MGLYPDIHVGPWAYMHGITVTSLCTLKPTCPENSIQLQIAEEKLSPNFLPLSLQMVLPNRLQSITESCLCPCHWHPRHMADAHSVLCHTRDPCVGYMPLSFGRMAHQPATAATIVYSASDRRCVLSLARALVS